MAVIKIGKSIIQTFITCLLLIPMLCCFLSCQEQEPDRYMISDYFSIKEGQESIFQVSEVTYDAGSQGEGVEQKYFEKRVVKEISSSQNIQTAILEIYKGVNSEIGINWTLRSIEHLTITPIEVIRTINNIPFRALVQPISHLASWNGNIYNQFNAQNFTYDLDVQSRDLKVIENEKSTLIDKYSKYKIYKKGIGIVYEEDISIEYCQLNDCIGKYVIESGTIKKMTLID